MSLCVFDHHRTSMEFAGANNGIFVLSDGELMEVKPTRNPIGIKSREIPFSQVELQYKTGDLVYLFTDGFQDQFGGERKRQFGRSRLKALLQEIHPLPMKEQKECLEKTLSGWMADHEQIDDISLIGLKM